MKVNDRIHGFCVTRVRHSEELGGTLYEMAHEKTGAQLAWLDNGNDNKLFSVTFKTLPWDDTGVFHILEHSVLAGSEHYPVKEPFLDLLKSSMNTFLNAMTFPDKTMYPVSSRNDKDFTNLMRVYLDAVFCPAIYHNESIFRQEGWHYEFDEKDAPFYNGVVFNEMKGALGSVDGQIEYQFKAALFPDSIYGYESGGDPQCIPDLTYDAFLRAHREFYAPSNARIYLDGAVALEETLAIIDGEYLSHFEHTVCEHTIVRQKALPARACTGTYEIGREESAKEKTQFVLGKIFASWEEAEKIAAYQLLASYFAGSNEAPLKRAVLEEGLAQEVEFDIIDGIAEPYYALVFRNTEPEHTEALQTLLRRVLEEELERGLNKEELTACLNHYEFRVRECEEPQGLIRNINAMNAWLYGGDMLLYLENNPVLASLRKKINDGGFDAYVRELLDFSSGVTLTLLPSKEKGEEERACLDTRVKQEVAAMDKAAYTAVRDTFDAMRLWQDTPDSEEAKATLPTLALSDVGKEPQWLESETVTGGPCRRIFHPLSTNGIVYTTLYFELFDENEAMLPALAVLTNLLGVLPTARHSAAALQREIKKLTGALNFNIEPMYIKEKLSECRPYFSVSFSALEENLAEATDLVGEILCETEYDHTDIIKENLLQLYDEAYQGLMSAGHQYALRRALAPSAAAAAVQEAVSGYAFFKTLEAYKNEPEAHIAQWLKTVPESAKTLFTSARLIISETAGSVHSALDGIAARLPQGTPCRADALTVPPKEATKEAIIIPAGVAYAVSAVNVQCLGYAYSGGLQILSNLLTYGYLWNEIRVHGGAYGCGFRAGQSGSSSFYSYRDPHPLQSLRVYRNTGAFIRDFADSDEPLDKYIISGIASTDALIGASTKARLADINYLSGITYEDKAAIRAAMLAATKEELRALCPLFDEMSKTSSVCVVGGEAALADLDDSYTVYRL